MNCVSHGRHDVPHHKFVVIASMIMKFGRGIKLDVFYTLVSKKFVTSLLLRNYDIIICNFFGGASCPLCVIGLSGDIYSAFQNQHHFMLSKLT